MKEYHIVYITVNKINNKIYVGVHKTNNPYKFDGYLGNGVWVRRGKITNPKTPFQHAVAKYGYDKFTRHTLMVFDSSEDAYAAEAKIVTDEFIKNHKTYNAKVGGLGGAQDYSLSKVHVYDKDTRHYITTLKKEAIKNFLGVDIPESVIFSEIMSNVKNFNKDAYGYLWSIKKLNVLPKRKTIPTKEIHQYNLNGDYLNTFSSTAEAARSLNLDNEAANTISKCANRIYSKAYGYIWDYTLADDVKGRAKEVHKLEKVILQYDKDGTLIREWESITEAAKTVGKKLSASKSGIYMCLHGKNKTAYGYVWKFKE